MVKKMGNHVVLGVMLGLCLALAVGFAVGGDQPDSTFVLGETGVNSPCERGVASFGMETGSSWCALDDDTCMDGDNALPVIWPCTGTKCLKTCNWQVAPSPMFRYTYVEKKCSIGQTADTVEECEESEWTGGKTMLAACDIIPWA